MIYLDWLLSFDFSMMMHPPILVDLRCKPIKLRQYYYVLAQQNKKIKNKIACNVPRQQSNNRPQIRTKIQTKIQNRVMNK